jgi:hypothetical protein
MKHLIGTTLLLMMAFVLRLFHPNIGLDIHVRDTYRVIPLRIVASWCLLVFAFVWLGVLIGTSRRLTPDCLGDAKLPQESNLRN